MAASNAAQSSTPCCLYCGYDRTGLDEDRRCPECGLRSVPEEFRRETQAVFDSRRRLYREGLRWFSKHPPGWFWSLDRPGDLRRSVWLVGMNIVLCLLIINAGVILGDLCWLRIVHEGAWYNPTDPAAPVVAAYRHTAYLGFAFRVRSEDAYNFDQWRDQPPGYALRWSLTARPIWNGSPRWHPVALIVPTWLVMVYVFLAFGGICSQLRKGLPSYARPLTSVTVAVNAASCRLPMQAASCLLLVAVEVVSRITMPVPLATGRLGPVIVTLHGGLWCIGVLPWIGLVRSDFTKTLIRSRWQAARLYLMYVIGFPLLLAVTVFYAAVQFRLLRL